MDHRASGPDAVGLPYASPQLYIDTRNTHYALRTGCDTILVLRPCCVAYFACSSAICHILWSCECKSHRRRSEAGFSLWDSIKQHIPRSARSDPMKMVYWAFMVNAWGSLKPVKATFVPTVLTIAIGGSVSVIKGERSTIHVARASCLLHIAKEFHRESGTSLRLKIVCGSCKTDRGRLLLKNTRFLAFNWTACLDLALLAEVLSIKEQETELP